MRENEQDVVTASKERSAGGLGTGADEEREGRVSVEGRSFFGHQVENLGPTGGGSAAR